jgi:hypothetical protein
MNKMTELRQIRTILLNIKENGLKVKFSAMILLINHMKL